MYRNIQVLRIKDEIKSLHTKKNLYSRKVCWLWLKILIDLTNEDIAVVTGADIYRYDAEIAVTFLGTVWNVIKQRIIL